MGWALFGPPWGNYSRNEWSIGRAFNNPFSIQIAKLVSQNGTNTYRRGV